MIRYQSQPTSRYGRRARSTTTTHEMKTSSTNEPSTATTSVLAEYG